MTVKKFTEKENHGAMIMNPAELGMLGRGKVIVGTRTMKIHPELASI